MKEKVKTLCKVLDARRVNEAQRRQLEKAGFELEQEDEYILSLYEYGEQAER